MNPEFYLALGTITLAAFALRIFRLGRWSFWIDELYSIRHAERIVTNGIRASDSHHPIYYLLIAPLFRRFGVNEWTARLPAAIIGALTIPILILALTPIIGSSATLILGLILAVSPWHIYWSQNARFYTLTFLLQALALLALYQFGETGRWESILFYLLLYGLAILAHETSALMLVLAAAYLILTGIFSLATFALVVVTPAIFSAIIFLALGDTFHRRVDRIRHQWREHFSQRRTIPLVILAGTLRYIGLAMVCIALVGFFYGWAQPNRWSILIAIVEFLPLVLAMLWACVAYSATRYAFIALLGFSLAAAQFAQAAFELSSWVGSAVVMVIVVTSLDDLYLYYFVQHGNRAHWKEILLAAKTQIADGDLILSTAPDLAQYYLARPVRHLFAENIKSLEHVDGKVWFILDDTFDQLPTPTRDWITQHSQIVLCDRTRFHWRAWTVTVRVWNNTTG